MKIQLNRITDFLLGRSRKAKIANYSIGGLLAVYFIVIAFPNFIFAHTFKYKNFIVHSTEPFGSNIQNVLKEAETNLSAADIYDENLTQDIYLCNGYTMYSILAPLSRKAFACNYPFVNNIFVAKCDIDSNLAYKNNEQDNYTRSLSQLIAHETTHALIRRRLGFWKSRTLPAWKEEGFCECVGYNNAWVLKDAKQFLAAHKEDNRGSTIYRKYYYAVSYLREVEKMKFDDIIATDLSFEQVLSKIEKTTETEN